MAWKKPQKKFEGSEPQWPTIIGGGPVDSNTRAFLERWEKWRRGWFMMEAQWGRGSCIGKLPCWLSVSELNLNNDAKTERFGDQSDRFLPSLEFFCLARLPSHGPPCCAGAERWWKVYKGEKSTKGGVRNTKTQPTRGRNFIFTVRGQLCEVICRGSPLNLQCL